MYRLLTILLCLHAATSAPQVKESDVTYVKIKPVVEDSPIDTTNIRESRIEKLPLTFPRSVSTNTKEPDKNLPQKAASEILAETKSELSEEKPDSTETIPDLSENQSDSLDQSETIQSDTISDPNGTEETLEENKTTDLSEVSPTDLSETITDTVLSETNQSDRRARYFDSAETTETTVDATKYEHLIEHAGIVAPKSRPKFLPKVPKSSYIPKPKVFQSYASNHLDVVGKRKFISKCSCQKIWNCPKLQISVPRCPDEYFLCCF